MNSSVREGGLYAAFAQTWHGCQRKRGTINTGHRAGTRLGARRELRLNSECAFFACLISGTDLGAKAHAADAADAEVIVIAARQPEMRFVAVKTAERQFRTAVFRGSERLVHQRTEDVNALRALLHEHGHAFPVGIRSLRRMASLLEDETACQP
ncbi:transposase [Thioclava sp. BHET1]|nr:transposase [Thioclava sp. BHET1]